MKNIVCNLCGGTDHQLLFKGHDRLQRVDDNEFSVVRCRTCGLVFLNPQPDAQEVSKYYTENYGPYQHGNDAIFAPDPIVSFLRRTFSSHKKPAATERAGSGVQEPSLAYLDFGCGGGANLERVRLEHPGWHFYGLDNSVAACARVAEKGFTIFCDDKNEAALPDGFFDVIYMSHVIEHVHDPMATLRRIHRALKPTGTLYVGTPNFDSYAAKLFRSFWYALEVPRHLFLFTPVTLKSLLEKAGFKMTKIVFDSGPKVAIRSLFYVLGLRDLRINPWLWRLFLPFSKIMAIFGKTSIMDIEAKKTAP
jgi:SAM-dependent methyltransferase